MKLSREETPMKSIFRITTKILLVQAVLLICNLSNVTQAYAQSNETFQCSPSLEEKVMWVSHLACFGNPNPNIGNYYYTVTPAEIIAGGASYDFIRAVKDKNLMLAQSALAAGADLLDLS